MNARRVARYVLALALAASLAAALGWSEPGQQASPPGTVERYAVRYEVLTPSIRQQLQARLADRGYYDGPIDGHIGPDTREALGSFQRASNLEATGLLDTSTAWALGLNVYVAIGEREPLTGDPLRGHSVPTR